MVGMSRDGVSSTESQMPVKSESYLHSANNDLKLAMAYALVLILVSLIPASPISEIIPLIGVFMLFFIPGYAILAMIFPQVNAENRMERLALSSGLSTALSFIIGLFLAGYLSNVRLDYIVLSLSVITIPTVLIAYIRRRRTGNSTPDTDAIDKILLRRIKEFFLKVEGRTERLFTGALAFVLICLILATACIAIMPKQGEQFTEFYILGPEGKATNYPLLFNIGEEKPVIVGVVNHEYRSVNYDLIVRLNNSNNYSQIYSDSYSLNHNQTLEKAILLKPDQKGDNIKVEFDLYIDGNRSAPYRELYTWISVK